MTIPRRSPIDNYSFLHSTLANEYGLTLLTLLDHKGYFDVRQTLLVDCQEGRFAVKVFQVTGHPLQDQRQRDVFQYLQSVHYPHIPRLLETRSGQPAAAGPGWWMQVMEYIPVGLQGQASPDDWRKLGAAAGRLNQFQDYPEAYPIPVDGAVKEIAAWAQGRPFERPLLDLLARLDSLQSASEMGLIHGEINPMNAARRDNGEMVILDWDEAGTGRLVLELGYPLITNFVTVRSHSLLVEEGCAFYAGYRSEHPSLPDQEMIFAAALYHAIRYMQFADAEGRWARILWAVDHQDQLMRLIR